MKMKKLTLLKTVALAVMLFFARSVQAGLLETQSNPVNWGGLYWGNPTNWDALGIPRFAADAAADGTHNRDVNFISIAHDAYYIYVRINATQGPVFGGDYNLWMDTDLNSGTGARNWSGTGSIGAEYLVTGAALIRDPYTWIFTGWLNWDQNPSGAGDLPRDVIFAMSRTAHLPGITSFDFTFQFYSSSDSTTGDWYPDSADSQTGDFFRYTIGDPSVPSPTSSSDTYQKLVLSHGPLAYYRLNETTALSPDVATNSSSIGANGNGIYTIGAKHPVSGAIIGDNDTAVNFTAVDTNSTDGGSPVIIPWPEQPLIRELWDNVGSGALNGFSNGSSSVGFDTSSNWHVNLGNLMKVAQDFDISTPPGPPANRGQVAGLSADNSDLGGLSHVWDTRSWATRALATNAQINFGTNGDYWITVRVDNAGDTAMGIGLANGGDGSAQFIGVGAMWNNATGPDSSSAGNTIYVSDGNLGSDSPYAIRAYGGYVDGAGLILAHLTTSNTGAGTLQAAVLYPGQIIPSDSSGVFWSVTYQFTNTMTATHLVAWLNGDTSGGAGQLDAARVTKTYKDMFEGALNTSGSFAIEAWLRPTIDGAGNAQSPLFNRDPDDTAPNRVGWDFFQRDTATGWNFRMFNGNAHDKVFDITGGAYSIGSWNHLVAVYDASAPSATLYLNGVQVAQSTSPNGVFAPNRSFALAIGGFTDASQNPFTGDMDEVAFYTNTLSAAQVLAHYQNGTNAGRGVSYSSLVLGDGAVEYLRLGDPGHNIVVNSGTLGSAADGVYNLNVSNGRSGPLSPGYTGFESSNAAAFFNGANSYIELRNPPALNFTGQLTLEAWVQPSVTPAAPGAYGNIIAHGYDEDFNEVALRVDSTGGTPQYSISTYTQWFGEGASANIPSGDLGSGVWVHVVGTFDGANWNIYRNGVLLASSPDTTGSLRVLKGNWAIGARGRWAHMNVLSSGLDRQFQGKIDEAAIYDRALSPAEVLSHYYVGVSNNPTLQISPSGPNAILTWPVGTLQEADKVEGPYNDVLGATPPSYPAAMTATNKFYRLKL